MSSEAGQEARPRWAWWPARRQVVQVVAEHDLWGQATAAVVMPADGRTLRVAAEDLTGLTSRRWSSDEVAWRAGGGLALHMLASGGLLSLRHRRFEPLPHQLEALDYALRQSPVRLLLAAEVGLGKTIEAGLIWSELKSRGLIRRVLVVAPKGVQLQWVAEMREKFGEETVRVGADGLPVDAGIDPWRSFDQIVCSLDSVKPLRQRTGWRPAQVAAYNEKRFRAVVEAGWDLVIIDEAHHVAGSSEEVARHRLALELARRSPNLLLLSATPHSGKTESFRRLLGLLDEGFVTGKPLDRDLVAALIVRTEKRTAVDNSGSLLFQPRSTAIEVVPYGDRRNEAALYDAVTEYVRYGYDVALRECRPAVAFLVLLMQRLVSSSTAAILATLERRLAAVVETGTPLQLPFERPEEWDDLTSEEQLGAALSARGAAWINEKAEVEQLVELARKAAAGVDAKTAYLLDLLRQVQREEGDPSVKLLIFTEFVPTQEMLLDLFERAGIEAVAINGSMSLDERAIAQDAFRESAQVLVATDAGGEGINLQFAHVVVNYDLPWNPMRIEQRIGRVDRIGQRRPVRAFNLVMKSSVDERVVEVLEAKLWRILRELGRDYAYGPYVALTRQRAAEPPWIVLRLLARVEP